MPVAPDGGFRFAKALADLYGDAAADLISVVSRRLARGITQPGWAEQKLSEILALRGDAQKLVASLAEAGQQEVADQLLAAYQAGVIEAGGPGVQAAAEGLVKTNQGAVQALARATADTLAATHTRILRTAEDVYQRTIAETVSGVVTGAQSRREATARAVSRFAAQGVTGFTDTRGRNWALESYAEMATRTAAGQAHVQGGLDRFTQQGRYLVIVSDAPEECEKCRPFEGRVLSLSGREPTDAEVAGHRYAGSLRAARSAGFMHPNCRHALSAFVPGLTRPPAGDLADPQGDTERQQQRALERAVRESKRRLAAVEPLGDTAQLRQERALLRARQERLQAFTSEHDRKRLRYREQVGPGTARPAPTPGQPVPPLPAPRPAAGRAVELNVDTVPPPRPVPAAPKPEAAFVERIAAELDAGRLTPAALREQAANASPLGKANAEAAIARHEATLAAREAERAARGGKQRTFASAQEARDWANSHWAGPDGYPPNELAVLRSYTGSGYGPMNSTLRSSKGKRTNEKIRTMDAAIERAARVPDDIQVVRNANLRQLGIKTTKGDPRGLVGEEFVDHGYLSTSVNRTGAMSGEVRLSINVPKGSRGIYVSGKGGPKSPSIISDYGGGESELILARGSRLVVRSVRKVGKRWHVEADLLQG